MQQLPGGGGGGIQIVIGLQPFGNGGLHGSVFGRAVQPADIFRDGIAQLLHRQTHTIGELGVVLKQGVGPGDTLALLVFAVRHAGHGGAPGLGAAGGVGQEHLVAEQLGQQLDIGRFAAAGAGTVEFHQGLAELAALQGEFVEAVVLLGDGLQVAPVGLVQGHLVGRDHTQGLAALGAGGHAAAAAGAVQGGNAHGELQARQLGTLGGGVLQPGRGVLDLVLVQQVRADHRMGAHKGAAVALDTLVLVPHGQVGGNAALFILGGAQGHGAVLHALEGGNRQVIALLGVDGHQDVPDDVGHVGTGRLDGSAGEVLPLRLDVHLHQGVDAGVHGGDVHIDDLFALEAVGLFHGVLHMGHGVLHGDHPGQLEEGGLEHHVGAVAQAQGLRLLIGVDDVEVDIVFGDIAEDVPGDVLLQLIFLPLAVQQEAAVGLPLGDDVILGQVRLVVAGHKVGAADIVGGADGMPAEAQVALGDAEGLLGVVLKVSLTVHIRGFADDLDGGFVGAHGAVGAQAPELAADGALRLGEQGSAYRQGQMGHIVLDADGEVILGLIQQQVVEHGLQLGGGGVLAGQAVPPGEDQGAVFLVDIGGADILVQRLADGAGLLHPVQHGDAPDCLGHGGHQVLDAEGAEQVHLQEAHLLAPGVQVIDDLLGAAGHAAHGHDDALGVGCAIVVEQVVFPARQAGDLGHVVLHHVGEVGVIGVVGLPQLEVDIGVIHQGAHAGVLGVQSIGPEAGQGVIVHQLGIFVVTQHVDLLDLVGGAEAIEEVQEGDTGADGGQMRHGGQVRRLLDAAAGQHDKAGLAAVHHVAVVAEDGEGVGSYGAGRHMQHAGQTLAGDAVHGGDHQHQALGCGEAGGQGAGLQCAVAGAAGTGLGLHLHQAHRLAEDVLLSLGGPVVGVFGHGAGGRDRIDGCNLGEGIGHIRRRLVAVTDFQELAHIDSSSYFFCGGPTQTAVCLYTQVSF